jgi:diguanylate cyclase (GGDEF)-like protein
MAMPDRRSLGERLFSAAIEAAETWPSGRSLALSLVALAAVAALDFWLPAEINIAIPYAFPVAIAAWLRPRAWTALMVPASATIWTWIQYLTHATPIQALGLTFVVHIVTLAVVAAVISLLRQQSLQVYKLSLKDSLTGLANRRQLLLRLEWEIERARRTGAPLSILLGDIDRFKHVNDTLGHAQGDRLLEGVAQALSSSFRRADLVSRLGGDEFAVLLPETDSSEAEKLVRRAVEAAQADLARYGSRISFGAVTFTGAPGSSDAALKTADEMMYLAKSRGGDGLAIVTVDVSKDADASSRATPMDRKRNAA